MLILLFLVFSRARCSRARALADCDYGVGVRVGRRAAQLWGHHDWRRRDRSAVRVDCYEVLRPYQQNGKTVAIRQFKGRTPPPSTRFRAFLADGVATTGALVSGFG